MSLYSGQTRKIVMLSENVNFVSSNNAEPHQGVHNKVLNTEVYKSVTLKE